MTVLFPKVPPGEPSRSSRSNGSSSVCYPLLVAGAPVSCPAVVVVVVAVVVVVVIIVVVAVIVVVVVLFRDAQVRSLFPIRSGDDESIS